MEQKSFKEKAQLVNSIIEDINHPRCTSCNLDICKECRPAIVALCCQKPLCLFCIVNSTELCVGCKARHITCKCGVNSNITEKSYYRYKSIISRIIQEQEHEQH